MFVFRTFLVVFLALWLLPCLSFAAPSAYRVVHAPPQEVVAALFLPMNSEQLRTAKARSGRESRLQKYFRLKSKTIRGPEVALELLPVIPVIEDYLPSTQPIKIVLTQTSQKTSTYNFDAHFELLQGRFFNAAVQISPHESGSLISLQLRNANLPDKVVQLFFYTAQQLGFVAETPEAAGRQDHLTK